MAETGTSLEPTAALVAAEACPPVHRPHALPESGHLTSLGFAPPPRTDEVPACDETLSRLRAAACAALDRGAAGEARGLIVEAAHHCHPAALGPEWQLLRDPAAWADDWLVAAIRCDPPDPAALDALAARYWKQLFGRCQLLTLDRQKASDLAQDAWCRVLRARHALKLGRSFSAYLTTIATNLWRDRHRAARRAGPMAEHRLASLDAAASLDSDDPSALVDVLPDVRALHAEQQRLLLLDIDHALGRLAPPLREVLVARLIDGESCAVIGRRHARTEQTISAWVREAIRQLKLHLAASSRGVRHPEVP